MRYVTAIRADGGQIAQAHLRHLNPFPANIEEVLRSYDKVVVPEINLGQLALLVRGRYLVDAITLSKVQGQPFKISEISERINEVLLKDE